MAPSKRLKPSKPSPSKPSPSSLSTPPPPFTLAPPTLEPLLSLLDPSKVYITHIDRHPAAHKRTIFAVPVLLNLLLAALLAWRLVSAVPWYLALLSTLRITTSTAPLPGAGDTPAQLAVTVLLRGGTFMLDFLLVRVVAPWPWGFFLERPGNPVLWRWSVGFREREVVVRESRGWGGEELMGGARRGGESPFFKTRVRGAVDRELVREKTGYLLMGKDWDLDFDGMVRVTLLLDGKEVEEGDVELSVWAHKDGLGWTVWRVEGEQDGVVDEETQRRKIMALKEKLTAAGKERLFFRWIEIVQYESSKSGEFNRKRQEETAELIKKEFEQQGVDFEKLVKEVGGLEGTPGM